MEKLTELFALSAFEQRAELQSRFENCWSIGAGPKPLIAGVGNDQQLLMEFDPEERLIFAEVNTYFDNPEDARRKVGEVENFVRETGLIVPDVILTQPLYRTNLAVDRVIDWRAWLQDDVTVLQVATGRGSNPTAHDRYGVSVSMHVVAGGKRYEPTEDDHSGVDLGMWNEPELDALELSLRDVLKAVKFVSDARPGLYA
jgi:hypothetical protein